MGSVRRLQRREYVRIPAEIDTELAAHVDLAAVDGGNPVEQSQIATKTVDLSGGGFAIRHSSALPQGAVFDVRIRIPALEDPVGFRARVVRCDPLEVATAEPNHQISFAIVDPSEAVRRHIMSFVIRLQQESPYYD